MSTRSLRVFVTLPIAEAALKRLAEAVRVELWDNETPPPAPELRKRLEACDAVLSMVADRLDAKAIGGLKGLRVISNLAVGVDNIDLAAATAAGIAVGHTPGVLTETTADLAFALMLAVARRITESDRFVRSGRWRGWTPKLMLGRDVWGATLGIIGWGAIGQAVARRATGFGMRVLYVTRGKAPAPTTTAIGATPAQVQLPELFAESDFVSLHVPLTPATRGMIGAGELAAMKRSAVLINTARGGVIDQAALASALARGRLGGAGLDVVTVEPIDLRDVLLTLPNVVVTPHIGSASQATRLKMADLAVDNILDVFAGRKPRFCANPLVILKAVPPPA